MNILNPCILYLWHILHCSTFAPGIVFVTSFSVKPLLWPSQYSALRAELNCTTGSLLSLMNLSQDTGQYLMYLISLSPYTPLSITICDLLIILFAVGKNRLQRFLQALGVWHKLSAINQTVFLDGTAVVMVLDVYFFPFLCPFLIHAATLAGMQIRSTAAPFDQMLGRQRQSWCRWYGCLGG